MYFYTKGLKNKLRAKSNIYLISFFGLHKKRNRDYHGFWKSLRLRTAAIKQTTGTWNIKSLHICLNKMLTNEFSQLKSIWMEINEKASFLCYFWANISSQIIYLNIYFLTVTQNFEYNRGAEKVENHCSEAVFLNRWDASQYRDLESFLPGLEWDFNWKILSTILVFDVNWRQNIHFIGTLNMKNIYFSDNVQCLQICKHRDSK